MDNITETEWDHFCNSHIGQKHTYHTFPSNHNGRPINRDISMNFDNALIYVHSWEPTQWDIYNLDRVVLTSDHPWDPS